MSGDIDDSLLVSVSGHIATLTLHRPQEGNAITPLMQKGLERAWTRVEQDPQIRVAIITGAGERHFCTGASISELRTEGPGAGLRDLPYAEANRFSPRHCDVSKPVICLVNGLVCGGGLHFVVDSDIVVATANAAFMDTHVNVGQVGALENIGLARRTTLGTALLLTLVGRSMRLSAERAFQLGLVDLLEPTANAATLRAQELAARIAENSPAACALSKRAIWASEEMGYQAALVNGWDLLKSHWQHPDFSEGPAAFMDKRAPKWT